MTDKRQCFVIQPFLDDYKKRYSSIYELAVIKAGLVPYRADLEFTPHIMILEILKEIEMSVVCLAEISEHNPNVWYEVGYADGRKIPVVFVCDNSKKGELPFDVNQRNILFYDPEDADKLAEEITKRLKKAALEEMPAEKEKATTPSTIKYDFKKAELTILRYLYYEAEKNKQFSDRVFVAPRMEREGFSHEAIVDAYTWLVDSGMIKKERITVVFISRFSPKDESDRYCLTDKGKKWCLKNKKLLGALSEK